MNWFWNYISTISIILSSLHLIRSQLDYPTANLSTSWINNDDAPHSINFSDGSKVRTILLRGTSGPSFACGFFCNGDCYSYLFAVFIVQTNGNGFITTEKTGSPQIIWSANRNNPVKIDAKLQLTSEGELLLSDSVGTLSWSTNTSGQSVAGLNLTEMGNLILFDVDYSVVWQSFDHPTDTLVLGQKLIEGQTLIPSASKTNWTAEVLYSFFVTGKGLFASIGPNPQKVYFQRLYNGTKQNNEPNYVQLRNGSLGLYINSAAPSDPDDLIYIHPASFAQFMKFGSDGHIRIYDWDSGWNVVGELLNKLGECDYPMACGRYGICSSGRQCSCPGSSSDAVSYFRHENIRQPNRGCARITPVTCSNFHTFVELTDVTYFTFVVDINDTDVKRCKEACLRTCTCKAAIFRTNSSRGECYLPTTVYSLMNIDEDEQIYYNFTVFLKVQIQQNVWGETFAITLGSIIGGFSLLIATVAITIFLTRRRKKISAEVEVEVEECYLDSVPGMPTRFSYEELKTATDNFSIKLGEGGFGSVFKGILKDGIVIAVKDLDGISQSDKSFLAEVETIGSTHHVNLVRLIGFCAEKAHRLLVYEYMSNGSLERWIYHEHQEQCLDWKSRKRVIFDIAKGLAYLHEDCWQKIIHLDIKPQNILLDENLTAKVSDFGLSKLIERDQSQVMTTMRGTPGYLAPEWLSAVITEKVDVYSFGVVVLEILCGRKHFEQSESEENKHLLRIFKKKAEEEKLSEMIDQKNADVLAHGEEVLKMMKVAAWCLQWDYVNRPSMSTVIKVLEGVMDVENNLDYGFFGSQNFPKSCESSSGDLVPLLP